MKFRFKYLAINVGKGLKYTILAINTIFMVLIVLSTYAQHVSPLSSVFFSYLGMGFPILLLVNICFLLLWCICLKGKCVFVQFLVLLFCWQAIDTYIPLNFKTEEVPEKAFRIMSYNVRGFDWLTGDEARENPILPYIANSGADIVCMQEFAVETDENKDKIISLNEFDAIMEAYPYRTIIRLGDTLSSTMYGLACYSKFPIDKVARVPIESDFNGSAMYDIKIGKKFVTIVNNHLESNRLTAEDKELYKELVVNKRREKLGEVTQNILDHLDPAFKARAIQADIIHDCVQQQRGKTDAMLICGDFNEPPISYAYERVRGNFLDAYKYTGMGPGITYHEDGFLFRIDYIFYSLNLQAYNCIVDKVKYSDHYPILSWISFK